MHTYIYTYIYIYVYICIPMWKYYERPLRAVILFIDNIFYNRFAKNVLNKQLWSYVFVIFKAELIIMSSLSYQFIAFIQQILCRENDVIFLCKA